MLDYEKELKNFKPSLEAGRLYSFYLALPVSLPA